jgi:hypothetical protein
MRTNFRTLFLPYLPVYKMHFSPSPLNCPEPFAPEGCGDFKRARISFSLGTNVYEVEMENNVAIINEINSCIYQ